MEDLITATVNEQSTDSLKEMATQLMENDETGTSDVLSAVLDVLMNRLPEPEFVALCEAL